MMIDNIVQDTVLDDYIVQDTVLDDYIVQDTVLDDDDIECILIERKVLALGVEHPFICYLFSTFQTDVRTYEYTF